MDPAVVDASVAIKWVYSEELSPNAIRIRSRYRLIAPELILAECANILWKKVHREELADNEAIVSAAAIGRAGIEMVPMAPLIVGATRLALDHAHVAHHHGPHQQARADAGHHHHQQSAHHMGEHVFLESAPGTRQAIPHTG